MENLFNSKMLAQLLVLSGLRKSLATRFFGLNSTTQSQNFTMAFPKAPIRSAVFPFDSEQKFSLVR